MKHRKSRYCKQREARKKKANLIIFTPLPYIQIIHSLFSLLQSWLLLLTNHTFIITQHTVADRTGGVVAEFRTENEHPGCDSHHLDIYCWGFEMFGLWLLHTHSPELLLSIVSHMDMLYFLCFCVCLYKWSFNHCYFIQSETRIAVSGLTTWPRDLVYYC